MQAAPFTSVSVDWNGSPGNQSHPWGCPPDTPRNVNSTNPHSPPDRRAFWENTSATVTKKTYRGRRRGRRLMAELVHSTINNFSRLKKSQVYSPAETMLCDEAFCGGAHWKVIKKVTKDKYENFASSLLMGNKIDPRTLEAFRLQNRHKSLE